MKIFTEFIIIHKNIGFPSEDDFCPYIWNSEYFDSDGDYYFYNIGDQWTNLDLKSFDEGEEAEFELTTYRESTEEKGDPYLKRYMDEFRSIPTWYESSMPGLLIGDDLAASSIRICAKNSEMYRKLLETVHFFLEFTQGYLMDHGYLNAAGFKKEFLGDEK